MGVDLDVADAQSPGWGAVFVLDHSRERGLKPPRSPDWSTPSVILIP
jgi:hypothetical protein